MLLFFDTETTGIPNNWNAPASQIDNWPRMVQLAWMQYDIQGNLILKRNHIIKPDGYTIPNEAAAIHGITTEYALENGSDIKFVLSEFTEVVNASNLLIAHNIDFDEKIIGAEYIRIGLKSNINKIQRLCTMKTTTNFCKIPGKYGYKWPTLLELHRYLFDSDFTDAHEASVDVKICAKCYFELVNRDFYNKY